MQFSSATFDKIHLLTEQQDTLPENMFFFLWIGLYFNLSTAVFLVLLLLLSLLLQALISLILFYYFITSFSYFTGDHVR